LRQAAEHFNITGNQEKLTTRAKIINAPETFFVNLTGTLQFTLNLQFETLSEARSPARGAHYAWYLECLRTLLRVSHHAGS
jgi:hypothetical protein